MHPVNGKYAIIALAVLEEVGCIAPSGGMTADMQLEL
jgi:hypothetical protein